MGSRPISFLLLWSATDHEPHCRQVNINKIWRRTESIPRSVRWRIHMAGIYSNCSTREIIIMMRSVDGVSISLPQAVSPQMDKPLKSVKHGQCVVRPTITFLAAGHHRPLSGTKLYCLVNRGTRVWITCLKLLRESRTAGIEFSNVRSQFNAITSALPGHRIIGN